MISPQGPLSAILGSNDGSVKTAIAPRFKHKALQVEKSVYWLWVGRLSTVAKKEESFDRSGAKKYELKEKLYCFNSAQ